MQEGSTLATLLHQAIGLVRGVMVSPEIQTILSNLQSFISSEEVLNKMRYDEFDKFNEEWKKTVKQRFEYIFSTSEGILLSRVLYDIKIRLLAMKIQNTIESETKQSFAINQAQWRECNQRYDELETLLRQQIKERDEKQHLGSSWGGFDRKMLPSFCNTSFGNCSMDVLLPSPLRNEYNRQSREIKNFIDREVSCRNILFPSATWELMNFVHFLRENRLLTVRPEWMLADLSMSSRTYLYLINSPGIFSIKKEMDETLNACRSHMQKFCHEALTRMNKIYGSDRSDYDFLTNMREIRENEYSAFQYNGRYFDCTSEKGERKLIQLALVLAYSTSAKRLKIHDANFRNFRNLIGFAFSCMLENNKSLRVLRLNNVKLTDEEGVALALSLRMNNTLHLLDLRGNKALTDVTGLAFCNILLEGNQTLCQLRVNENQFSPRIQETIDACLARNRDACSLKEVVNTFEKQLSEFRSLANLSQNEIIKMKSDIYMETFLQNCLKLNASANERNGIDPHFSMCQYDLERNALFLFAECSRKEAVLRENGVAREELPRLYKNLEELAKMNFEQIKAKGIKSYEEDQELISKETFEKVKILSPYRTMSFLNQLENRDNFKFLPQSCNMKEIRGEQFVLELKENADWFLGFCREVQLDNFGYSSLANICLRQRGYGHVRLLPDTASLEDKDEIEYDYVDPEDDNRTIITTKKRLDELHATSTWMIIVAKKLLENLVDTFFKNMKSLAEISPDTLGKKGHIEYITELAKVYKNFVKALEAVRPFIPVMDYPENCVPWNATEWHSLKGQCLGHIEPFLESIRKKAAVEDEKYEHEEKINQSYLKARQGPTDDELYNIYRRNVDQYKLQEKRNTDYVTWEEWFHKRVSTLERLMLPKRCMEAKTIAQYRITFNEHYKSSKEALDRYAVESQREYNGTLPDRIRDLIGKISSDVEGVHKQFVETVKEVHELLFQQYVVQGIDRIHQSCERLIKELTILSQVDFQSFSTKGYNKYLQEGSNIIASIDKTVSEFNTFPLNMGLPESEQMIFRDRMRALIKSKVEELSAKAHIVKEHFHKVGASHHERVELDKKQAIEAFNKLLASANENKNALAQLAKLSSGSILKMGSEAYAKQHQHYFNSLNTILQELNGSMVTLHANNEQMDMIVGDLRLSMSSLIKECEAAQKASVEHLHNTLKRSLDNLRERIGNEPSVGSVYRFTVTQYVKECEDEKRRVHEHLNMLAFNDPNGIKQFQCEFDILLQEFQKRLIGLQNIVARAEAREKTETDLKKSLDDALNELIKLSKYNQETIRNSGGRDKYREDYRKHNKRIEDECKRLSKINAESAKTRKEQYYSLIRQCGNNALSFTDSGKSAKDRGEGRGSFGRRPATAASATARSTTSTPRAGR